jgi:hypothetical protein
MLVAVVAAAGTVSAQEAPKWSYIEAGFIDFNPDEGVSDDGFFVGGSFTLFKSFHVLAEYDEVGDYSFWDAGVGVHGLLGEKADLFAEATWQNVEVDTDSGNVSDDGYEVAGGIRWMLGSRFELKGTVNWVDFDESGDDTTVEAEGLFFLLENKLGLGASYEVGDSDTARLFARWNFGR